MKKYLTVGFLSVALLAGACSENVPRERAGEGSVRFDCMVATSVGTRADMKALPQEHVPDIAALRFVITGDDGVEVLSGTMEDYDQPLLSAGTYTASFSYGDPEAEGATAAHFTGERSFTVVARKTVTEPVTVSLVNSVVSLTFSEWFNKYYTDFTINIRTTSGYRAGFVGSRDEPLTETFPVYVKPGTKLFLSGRATKTNGFEVTFPETLVGTTEPRTWHTLRMDAAQVGQAGIVVSLDDTVVAVEEIVVELNPEA